MANSGPRWSAEEDAELRRLVGLKWTWLQIEAAIPGRTNNACLARANKLRIPPPDTDRQVELAKARSRVRGRFVPVDQVGGSAD